jgi:hypothetical protein
VLESLSAATALRFVALAGAVDSLNATIADQQVSLANLSSVTVPHLNWLAGAVDSLNATIVSHQVILACVRPTQVVSISPSSLSLCTGNWTAETITGQNMTLRWPTLAAAASLWRCLPGRSTRASRAGSPSTRRAHLMRLVPALHLIFGDSLTIWSGSTLLWDYAVTGGLSPPDTCPASGGPQPSALLNGFWSCATGNSFSLTAFYNVPLFGPSQGFVRNLPAATSAPIELRFCLDQPRSNDEEIYLHSASISVRL